MGDEEVTVRAKGDPGERARLLVGIAVTERRLELAGRSTVVLEGGDGPPVVLLHGGIPCGGAYWAPTIAYLLDRHRVVVPDVPGLGESEPFERFSGELFADWLAAVLRFTCDEAPTLIAHSTAGSLAAAWAARDGDRLRRLVIYGAPGIGGYRLPLGLQLAAIRFDVRPTRPNLERFERWAFRDLDGVREREPGWFAAFDAYMLDRGALPHVKRTLRRLVSAGVRRVPERELGRIATPTTLLWGEHDRMVPRSLAEAPTPRRGWPLHVIHGAGHVPHLEQPGGFQLALERLLETSTERSPTA
jgi:pimeloyl-ACP methyl ester carboxylesterase